MRRPIRSPVLLPLAIACGALLFLAGCGDKPAVGPQAVDAPSIMPSADALQHDLQALGAQGGGAYVRNRGGGQPSGGSCWWGGWGTSDITFVHNPGGVAIIKCFFTGLPARSKAYVLSGWYCSWWIDGVRHWSYDSKWTHSPSGHGMSTCRLRT